MTAMAVPFALLPRRTVLEEPADEAILAFRAAAEAHPKEPDYRFMLGEALIRAGRIEAAVAEMRAACEIGPPHAEYLSSVGAALLELGRPDEAEAALRAALALEPERASALGRHAVALASLGRADEARRAADQACRRAPASAEAARHRGIALFLLGDANAALASLRSAVRLEPSLPDTHHDLGLALHAAGRIDEALAEFETTVDLDPSYLGVRPASREIVDACRLTILRSEMAPQRSSLQRGVGAAFSVVDAVHDVAKGGRRVGRRLLSGWTLVAALLVGYVAFRMVIPYAEHLRFQDRMREIARVPVRNDLEIQARLMREVAELGLTPYVHAEDCTIGTGNTFRTIVCTYRRPIPLLPGVAPVVSLRARVEVAVVFGPDTQFF